MKPAETSSLDLMAPWKLLFFINWFSQGKTDKVTGTSFMLSSVSEEPKFYELFENILAWIFLGSNSWNLRHPSKLLSIISNKKNIIFSDISLPRLGKNMIIALQRMTESQKKKKKKKKMSKHSKKFRFRLEKTQ